MKKAICLPDTLVKTKHYRGRWFFILMVLFDGIKIFKKQKKLNIVEEKKKLWWFDR